MINMHWFTSNERQPQRRLPSNPWYKMHLSGQLNYWSLRCSWNIACRHCSNSIFVLDLTPGFNRLRKDNCKTRRKIFKFRDLVHLILDISQYMTLGAIEHRLFTGWCYGMANYIGVAHRALNKMFSLLWYLNNGNTERFSCIEMGHCSPT